MERYSGYLKAEIEKKMLEAVSSLKRAIGAADSREQPDYIDKEGLVHVHTPDDDSNSILNALFHQFLHGDAPVFALDKQGKSVSLPCNFAFQQGDRRSFEVELHVPDTDRLQFIERIDNYIEKLIAPTGPATNESYLAALKAQQQREQQQKEQRQQKKTPKSR